MSNVDVIRAWKDEEYRNSLTPSQLADLPENPAGLVELNDDDLFNVEGGSDTAGVCISAIVVSIISWIVTEGISCSVNCQTMFQGSCGAWSVGCC